MRKRKKAASRLMRTLALFVAVLGLGLLFSGEAEAKNATQGYWEYSLGSEGATVERYTGGEANVTVPSDLGGKPVAALGRRAFKGNKYLVTVTLPPTTTDIGLECFKNCESLKAVYGLEHTCFIGNSAFWGCSSLSDVKLGSGLRKLDNMAFRECVSLKRLTLPSALKTIGYGVFIDCDALEAVTIPASVTSLGDNSFESCDSLQTVSIQAALETMGTSVFNCCSSLTSVSIGGNVQAIGGYAFYHCTALDSVSLASGLREIGYDAFDGCTSLSAIQIPGTVRTIGRSAFNDCSSLRSVELNYGLVTIGAGAFCRCEMLTSVTLPSSVTYLGGLVFQECTALTNVLMPNSIVEIEDLAENIFYGCPAVIACYEGSYAETYAKDEGIDYTIFPSVPSTSFDLSVGTLYLMEGERVMIPYTIAPADTTDAVLWGSSASDIASTPNGVGEVTAKRAGSATIVATTTSGIRKTVSVVVSNRPTKISFETAEKTIQVGKTYTQAAVVRDVKGVRSDIKPDYSSSDPSIAVVDANGKVKGLRPGTVTITAKTYGLTASYRLTVVKVTGTTGKAIKKLRVKRKGKLLTVTTVKGAKVKVTAKKSVLGKASKTVKANSKGVAKIKFKKKIRKVTVKITVSKSGYKKKSIRKKY